MIEPISSSMILVFLVEVNRSRLALFLADSAFLALQDPTVVGINGMGGGDALGKPAVNRFSGAVVLVVEVEDIGRALFSAGPTAGAFCLIDIAGLFPYLDLETAGTAFDLLNFAVGQQLDIGMSTDIQHFRREDSDGAVVGGKCLVQLSHFPADTRQPLDKIHLETHFRQIQ